MKKYFGKFDKIINNDDNQFYYEKNYSNLERKSTNYFFNDHLKKSMIAKKKKVSRNFVIRWTQSKIERKIAKIENYLMEFNCSLSSCQ